MIYDRNDIRANFAIRVIGRRITSLKLLLSIVVCLVAATNTASSDERASIEPTFSRDIYPIFQERCAKCHTKKKRGRLSLNARESILIGGKSGAAVIPGDSENSLLYKMITKQDGVKSMPRRRAPLEISEIKLIKKWIETGAK